MTTVLTSATAAAAAATATATAAAAAAAFAVAYGCLSSVFQKEDIAVLRDAKLSVLFSIRDLYFYDFAEFRRFARREHSQNDAGKNLAFFKFDGIIG